MEGAVAGRALFDQVHRGQALEVAGSFVHGEVQEGGGCGEARGRSRTDREQAEGAGLLGRQVLVAHREGRPHRAVLHIEHVQPLGRVGEVAGQVLHEPVRAGHEPAGREPNRERQTGTRPEHHGFRARLGSGPLRTHDATEERRRLLLVEDAEGQPDCTVEPQERAATGDQDPAVSRTRQQWAHLGGVADVVQEDQHAPLGEQAPVLGSPLVRVDGDLFRSRAERPQEPREDILGSRRHGVGAVQVDLQLTVRKPPEHAVCDVQRQRRLAHAPTTADRREHHRCRGPRGLLPQQSRQALCHSRSAGEVGQIR